MEKEKINFYDRKNELALLNEKYAQIKNTGKGVMIALYGRRRVGKTELIKNFLKGTHEEKLYFYVGLSQRKVIFNSLTEAIKEYETSK